MKVAIRQNCSTVQRPAETKASHDRKAVWEYHANIMAAKRKRDRETAGLTLCFHAMFQIINVHCE